MGVTIPELTVVAVPPLELLDALVGTGNRASRCFGVDGNHVLLTVETSMVVYDIGFGVDGRRRRVCPVVPSFVQDRRIQLKLIDSETEGNLVYVDTPLS